MHGAAQGAYSSPQQNNYGNGGPAGNSRGPVTNAKIYVSNMPSNCDERQLTEIFGRYGDIVAITHKGTFAFVEFSDPRMADDAIAEIKQQGTQLRV